jgi:hypothetical protein
VVIGVYAALFFPGTFIHELSHLITALLLQVPVGEVSLFPDLNEKDSNVRLGSVEIAEVDPFRRTIVGVAPIIFGTIVLISGLFLVFGRGGEIVWWQLLIAFYVVFTVSNTMFSSKKDLEGVGPMFVAVLLVGLLIGLVVYLIGIRVSFDFSNTFLSESWVMALQRVELFLAVPILINAIVLLLLRALQKRF